MTKFLPLFACAFLASCSGSLSTIEDGYAYAINRDQASYVVHSAMRAYGDSERPVDESYLSSSSYDRNATDSRVYTLTAIPVPGKNAYGLELTHEGTTIDGPMKARAIFQTANQRAAQAGPKILLK